MKKSLLRMFFAGVLLAPTGAYPQVDFAPVDEAASVPDFFSFRAQLQAAVARRDAAAVTRIMHRDVKLSFGGAHGIEDFRQRWQPESARSPLWETLATILALGGRFSADRSVFTAPYVFSAWPEGVEPFDFMAVIASEVRVRSAPALESDILDTLSFTTVRLVAPFTPDADWIRVQLADGRVGYMSRRFLRSPVDYRIGFSKIDGRWQATFFVAGD